MKKLLLSKKIWAVCRFTLTRGAILFVGGVIVQLDYNVGRIGEGAINMRLYFLVGSELLCYWY